MKLLSFIMLLFFTNNIFACDFSKDITQNSDGSYTYTKGCHVKVGEIVETNATQKATIELLNKSLELKDLAIQNYEKRNIMWMNTSMDLEKRLSTIERVNNTNKLLYFGLGIVVSGLAVYGASQIVK